MKTLRAKFERLHRGKKMKVAPDGTIMVEPTRVKKDDSRATSQLSNRKAKRISKSANKAKRSVVEFKEYLNDNNIALDPNGEYIKYAGDGIKEAKRRAKKVRDENWTAHIKPEDNVEARPVSNKELKHVQNRYDNVIKASEEKC